jgi:hypothetical protein
MLLGTTGVAASLHPMRCCGGSHAGINSPWLTLFRSSHGGSDSRCNCMMDVVAAAVVADAAVAAAAVLFIVIR